jgi:hypothetical protein
MELKISIFCGSSVLLQLLLLGDGTVQCIAEVSEILAASIFRAK